MFDTTVITGASSGFGYATAQKFAPLTKNLVLLARSHDKLQRLENELSQQCKVFIHCVDLSDRESLGGFINENAEVLENTDVLINNAGLALGLEPADKCDLNDWETMVDVNIKGLMRMTHAMLPGMVKRNRGHIVNIGSVAGSWPYPGGQTYAGTKAFVQQFTRALRCDLLGKNVRVSNIEPGMANTQFSVVRMKGNQTKADQVYEGTQPLKAEDIADIILWTCSLPPHVNINTLEVMPTCQAWSPFAVDRSMVD